MEAIGEERVAGGVEDADEDERRQGSLPEREARADDQGRDDQSRDRRDPHRERSPEGVTLAGGPERDEEEPEGERGHEREPDAGRRAPASCSALVRGERDARQRERDAESLEERRALAVGEARHDGDDGRRGRDRSDDAHVADRQAPVEGGEPDGAAETGEHRIADVAGLRRPVAAGRDDDRDRQEPRGL